MRPTIEDAILHLLAQRAADASICPSDVARHLDGEGHWRALMDDVRAMARQLARRGLVRVTAGERTLDPDADWHGPVRIRRGAGFENP